MQIFSKTVNFIKEAKLQLTKVSWPTRRELISATSVVITTTFLAAVFIGIIDVILSRMVNWVFR